MKRSPYVSLPEASKRLAMSLGRVIALIHRGALRAKLCGTRWWVERASLDEIAGPRRSRGRAA